MSAWLPSLVIQKHTPALPPASPVSVCYSPPSRPSRQAQRIRRGLDAGPLHGVLHRLVLDGNPIGDAGAELLCDASSSDYTGLAELRLCRCNLGERGAAAAGRLLENSRCAWWWGGG